MDERRKINAQHKYKDKRRNAKSTTQPNAAKTTQPKASTASTPSTTKPLPPSPSASSRPSSPTNTTDSADPYGTRQFSKRTIVKNWDKYDLDDASNRADGFGDDDDDDGAHNEQMSAADFGQLLRAPPAEGAHFRFSSEKNWDVDESDLFGTQFFRMDVSQMERLLLAVPFHKRQRYDASMFTADELQRMEADSKAHHIVGGGGVPLVTTTKRIELRANPRAAQQAEPTKQITPSVVAKIDDTELDDLLNMVMIEPAAGEASRSGGEVAKRPSMPVVSSVVCGEPKAPAPETELQQWLDGILDD